MNTSELKISVVVPVYNCEKYIERAIESVIKQTYDNWELDVYKRQPISVMSAESPCSREC